MDRYREKGWLGFEPQSKRPHYQPKKTHSWIVDKILKLKKEKPEMGSRAVSETFTNVRRDRAMKERFGIELEPLDQFGPDQVEARHKLLFKLVGLIWK